MNKLTCNHEFDFNRLLLTNPPQVRCKHCHVTVFIDNANEFVNQSKAEKDFEIECRELWKSSALAFLSTGETTRDHDGKLTSSAAGVADCMVKHFKSRFGVLS